MQYSRNPEIEEYRIQLVEFARKNVTGKKEDNLEKMLELLENAQWRVGRAGQTRHDNWRSHPDDVYFENGQGYYNKQVRNDRPNPRKFFFATTLPSDWKNKLRDKTRDSAIEYRTSEVGQANNAERCHQYRSTFTSKHIFYFIGISPPVQTLERSAYFADPTTPKSVYPGQYVSVVEDETSRKDHFYDPSSIVWKAAHAKKGLHCYDIKAIVCLAKCSREQGEAFVMV